MVELKGARQLARHRSVPIVSLALGAQSFYDGFPEAMMGGWGTISTVALRFCTLGRLANFSQGCTTKPRDLLSLYVTYPYIALESHLGDPGERTLSILSILELTLLLMLLVHFA